MKNLLMTAAVCAAACARGADTGPVPGPEAVPVAVQKNVEDGWTWMMSTWHPGTGMIYGCPVGDVQPAKDFTNGLLKWYKGCPHGYGRGIGDCAIVSGVSLSMLCDKYAVTKAPAVKDDAKKVAFGLLNLARSHGYKGFVARGLCAEDGKSICALSSRDQVTHWVHGLWRYSTNGWADAETKADFAKLCVDVAGLMLRNVTPENEYNFLQADGSKDPRGICTMWGPNVYPHEAARLPMIYAVAWKMSGDVKWRDLYEKYIDQALDITLTIKDKPTKTWAGIMPTYSLLQMNTSLEVLLGIERDPARRARMEDAARYAARMADERAMDMMAHPGKTYYGLCVDGEIALAQLMASGWAYSADERVYLLRGLGRPLARSGAFNASHMAAAYWRARANGVF